MSAKCSNPMSPVQVRSLSVPRGLSWGEFIAWLFKRRLRYRVSGVSMLPTLNHGIEVLIDPRSYRVSSPQIGDIVLFHHPYQRGTTLIKRISRLSETTLRREAGLFLEGDNSRKSTDSRHFGPVPLSRVIGKVTSRFA